MKRLLCLAFLSGLLSGSTLFMPAVALADGSVINTLRAANGHYVAGGASLTGADCSGLVSVAQSLATGQPIARKGNTHSLLAGRWPHAVPGATPDDAFVIGANSSHMVASVRGVNIEATTSGRPFLIGPEASSPFEPRFRQWHIDPAVLVI